MENFELAIEYHLKALTMRQNLFSGDYEDISESYSNLAFIYELLGDQNKSEEYLQK